jgi:hypothetical protein
MTALKKFEKLEATALWRESSKDSSDQGKSRLKEVFVSFGDTSLIIRDKHETPLSHWSLPAVSRLNPGQIPAIYSPYVDADETIEIDDITMIEAIETVSKAIDRRRPRPGRLRLTVFVLLSLTTIGMIVFWLPDAIKRNTLRTVPPEIRQQIGREVLDQIGRLAGKPCSSRTGNRALIELKNRLMPNQVSNILVLAAGISKSASLPGGFILLNRRLVEDPEAPDLVASYILATQLSAQLNDPLAELLDLAGGFASLKLLTTGQIDQNSIMKYAEHVLTKTTKMPPDQVILKRFKQVKLASSPLAFDLDSTGETTLHLIESDPFGNLPYPKLLSDADWIGLQTICDN